MRMGINMRKGGYPSPARLRTLCTLLLWGMVLPMMATPCAAQVPGVDYILDRTVFDLGEMRLGESYKAAFVLTSTSDKPLVLLDAKTNCSCTKVEFSKKPLMKGEKTTLTVLFDARDAGAVNKTVGIRVNTVGKRATFTLTITGNVQK